ncbi:conserved Plasmodium protein, unknown function [Plasmodium vivax]|uniref:Phospholipid/glycerol acyltransferase domain-containing protein n=5 Tax=Plasmodium vivax TaxID=5855 RepID=A5K3T4_PLAVS|nr:hypothetical protein, conserved [Plasmodium vivax]KMZ87093.1 hypothetical protein PVBG_03878 [Plasmodium vivax Brazil I]KMZ91731.1 hypothetical protein PVMG_00604 [Plasmodium vivax Mauritania I]KMZ97830.1 hypothetical protein PVNG_06236 [Plasmodium vivax North Korean]EDL46188.1 hypothetical protein, conserved [Plasmodium vivax]CAI7722410.1 conserved protein, unknown function [Plasmodium vivax]|eukprot:XP_001615915.1 hypothetical protein [Plasmodium vivax Sal-1]
MEKYREFADAATGINPFLPVWVNNKLSVHEKLLKFLLFPLVLCRFCFLSLTLIFMIFLNSLVNLFIFQCVKDFFYQIIQGIYCRLLLFYLGFFYMDEEYASHKRVKIKCMKKKIPFSYDDYGHIYLSNFTSFVDILYLAYRLNPLFVIINKNGSLSPVFFFDLIKLSLQFSLPNKKGEFKNLEQVHVFAKNKKIKSVVIFPEGMKSNGSCILLWKNEIFTHSEYVIKNKCNLIAFTYETSLIPKKWSLFYTSPHTVFNPVLHIILLCFNIYNKIKIVWLSEKDIAESLREFDFSHCDELVHYLRSLMGLMKPTGGTLVNVKADLLEKFVKYWNLTRGRAYL